MAGAANKNQWTLLLILLSGIVLGGFLGHLCRNVSWLSWLAYGQTFGLSSPVVLDLGIMVFTFGLATLSAMKVYEYTEEQISDMLTREFVGAVMMMKSDLKKTNTNKPQKNGGTR